MTTTYNPLKPPTAAIDKTIAFALRDGLASYQDGHSVCSYADAIEFIHDAGLSTCLIPYRLSTRSPKWDVMCAVIDRGIADQWGSVAVRHDERVVLKTYALLPLRPMQEYVGDLMTCNLEKPWFAVHLGPLKQLLVPTPSARSGATGHGTAAAENWRIFTQDFHALWGSGEHVVHPSIQLDIRRLRYPMAQVQPETGRTRSLG